MKSNPLYKQIASLAALALVFLIVSYAAQRYHSELAPIVGDGGALGVVGFIALTAVFVIFVIPLDIAFLIPIGSAVFGPLPTALMSITGWTLGAAAAFGIARRFGRPVVERLAGLERVRIVERRIPKSNIFLSVIVLRMLVSVDIISYALGLVSSMSWGCSRPPLASRRSGSSSPIPALCRSRSASLRLFLQWCLQRSFSCATVENASHKLAGAIPHGAIQGRILKVNIGITI